MQSLRNFSSVTELFESASRITATEVMARQMPEEAVRLTGLPLVCARCGLVSVPEGQYCGVCQRMVDFREACVKVAPRAIIPIPVGLPVEEVNRIQAEANAPRTVTLILPYPISANRYWRSFMPKGHMRPVTTISQEAKDYRAEVAAIAKAAGVLEPIQGRVHIDVKLYPNRPLDWQKRMRKDGPSWDDTVQCLDLDNARKVAYDSLKGVVIGDDKWVRSDSGERMEPDEHGARLVVTVTALAVDKPQGTLL